MIPELAAGVGIAGVPTGILLSGFRFLQPDERAAIYKWGEPDKNQGKDGVKGPGLRYNLPIKYQMKIVSTRNHHLVIPAAKERIKRKDDEALGPGEKRPMRIVHASAQDAKFYFQVEVDQTDDTKKVEWKLLPYNEYLDVASKNNKDVRKALEETIENDPLQSSLTTEIIAFVDWDLGKIDSEPDNLFNFFQNVVSEKKANKMIYDTVRSTLQQIMGPITARNALDSKAHIEQLLLDELEYLFGELDDGRVQETGRKAIQRKSGVNISNVRIEEVELGKHVNLARAKEASSVSNRRAAIRESEGLAQATRNQADADAHRISALGRAENEAFASKATTLATEGGFRAAQLDTIRSFAKANTIVTPINLAGPLSGSLDAGGLMGTVMASAQAIDQKRSPDTTTHDIAPVAVKTESPLQSEPVASKALPTQLRRHHSRGKGNRK